MQVRAVSLASSRAVTISCPPTSSADCTTEQVDQLRELAEGNTPAGVMSVEVDGQKTNRSEARAEGITLTPPNRSPYDDMS